MEKLENEGGNGQGSRPMNNQTKDFARITSKAVWFFNYPVFLTCLLMDLTNECGAV